MTSRTPCFVKSFGGISVERDGCVVNIPWESRKARLLFFYLLVNSEQWVHRDKVIELLWPGRSVASEDKNFKTTLCRLRKSLSAVTGSDPILSQGRALRIDTNNLAIDVSLFRHAAATGIKLLTRGDLEGAQQHLEAAQDLYEGEFLPEEPFDPTITKARSELSEMHCMVLRGLERIYTMEGAPVSVETFSALKRLTLDKCS